MPTDYTFLWAVDIPRLRAPDWTLFAQLYPDAIAWLQEAALHRELEYLRQHRARSQWHKNRRADLQQWYKETPHRPEILALYDR
jgi:hypothetical protein